MVVVVDHVRSEGMGRLVAVIGGVACGVRCAAWVCELNDKTRYTIESATYVAIYWLHCHASVYGMHPSVRLAGDGLHPPTLSTSYTTSTPAAYNC